MSKKFSIFLAMLVCVIVAYAIPAANVTLTHTQKDGTVLTLRLVGDEHMHYYLNVATGQAMRKGADGDFVVISSAELSAKAEQAAVRRANVNRQRVARLPLAKQQAREGMRKIGTIDKNLSGNKSVLVLLVAFSDKTFTGSQSDFDNQFNQQNYSANSHIGSVHDYFYDQSYGALNLSFDVYGPITLSNTMEYYGANDANGDDVRPRQMVKEAVQKANTSYDIDFTKYDWDNDGKVDQVVVIYAGYAESQGAPANTIWPHQWELSGIGTLSGTTYDNKTINSYACLSELKGKTGSTRDGIGTFCHEFSHCLGLPDFYDTNYSTDGTANDMSYFDVMAAGSYNGSNNAVPCGYTAYERWQFGWVTPTELSEAATITGMKPLNDANPDTYVIYNKRNNNEYFLLENRQSNRWFKYSSTYTAGHGLFITHCNYVSSYWTNNTINATAGNEHFVYVPANSTYGTSSTNMQNAFFPAGATSFTDDTHASCGGALWTNNSDGTKKLGVPITDIAESNGLISFDVLGGMHDDGSRYTVTLDACGGSVSQTSWTQTTYKQSWSLPEPTTTVVGWEGTGWSLTKIDSNTPLDDVELIDFGSSKPYTPESDVTLYAVYYNEDFICNSYPVNTHYTVTFDAGAGTCATTSWTQTDQQQKTTLPTATISLDGWSFAGWATTSATETLAKPSLLAAGADYTPAADVTLYAVYKKSTGGNGKISSVDEITDGDQYVFVISDGTTSYAVQQDASNNFVSFTESDEFASSIIWTAATATNGFSFKCNSKYLYNSGDNTTINAASATATDWVFTSLGNNLFKMQRANTSGRYMGWSGSKFAAYANNNFVNQVATSATLAQYAGALYIYKIGGSTTYNSNPQPEVTPDPEPGDGGDDDADDDPVVPVEPGTTALYFPHIAKLGQPFTAPAFNTNSDGAQTWASSNTDVADVDDKGHVTIKAVGTTIITVTQAETATYKQGTASYMIKVVE